MNFMIYCHCEIGFHDAILVKGSTFEPLPQGCTKAGIGTGRCQFAMARDGRSPSPTLPTGCAKTPFRP